ncbi:uncharacterized protein LOC141629643 [Silene latifolia]|uniref:uncharacterized protein LOC141629643 n=1 Tax=Silene latifolia TaxID=37657 RepID=UPI003D77B278
MKIACWNIRGFNDKLKQEEVKSLLTLNNVDIFGLLETRVKAIKASRICRKFSTYSILNNYQEHYNGRIWVFYKHTNITLRGVQRHSQFINCDVNHNATNVDFGITFVYGSNDGKERLALWEGLGDIATKVHAWSVLGDFNIVRSFHEREGPTPPSLKKIQEFNGCLNSCGLDDIHCLGSKYTWSNKQDATTRTWSRLDRTLINPSWLNVFSTSYAQNLLPGISDHSPERHLQHTYCKAKNEELDILAQRAKAQDIKDGDCSSKYFFSRIASRKHCNTIGTIQDSEGHSRTGYEEVNSAFVEYYHTLLGNKTDILPLDECCMEGPTLSQFYATALCLPFTRDEIKSALFSIGSTKSPGQDGFSSEFFKSSWDIIEDDFCTAVLDFFRRKKMMKQANMTLLALIPKKRDC